MKFVYLTPKIYKEEFTDPIYGLCLDMLNSMDAYSVTEMLIEMIETEGYSAINKQAFRLAYEFMMHTWGDDEEVQLAWVESWESEGRPIYSA